MLHFVIMSFNRHSCVGQEFTNLRNLARGSNGQRLLILLPDTARLGAFPIWRSRPVRAGSNRFFLPHVLIHAIEAEDHGKPCLTFQRGGCTGREFWFPAQMPGWGFGHFPHSLTHTDQAFQGLSLKLFRMILLRVKDPKKWQSVSFFLKE